MVRSPIRILTAGIRHESNTFCPILTTEEDFTVLRYEEVLESAEWVTVLQELGAEIIPILHAYATPFGIVSRSTYDKFKEEILTGVRNAGQIDGIYLDMHGALHVEKYEDAQADFVRSLREIIGEDTVISASFDLHGNISTAFVNQLNISTAYRTTPHVDEAETQVRAVRLLFNAIQRNQIPKIAQIRVPILIPGEKGVTAVQPLKSLYSQLPTIAQTEGILDASIFVGMAWADVPHSSMCVQVVAADRSKLENAQKEARKLAQQLWKRRDELKYDVPTDTIDRAIETAMNIHRTVFITDSGDNITAGAAGDGTFVLERLIANGIKDAVVAGIVDRDAVEICVKLGVGARVTLTVGGKIDTVFSKPLKIEGIIRHITQTTSNSKKKAILLEINGILVVILNVRRSFMTSSDFEEVDIDPLAHKIVIVKLGYLVQALRNIAPHTIMALTQGFTYQILENLPYKNLDRPIYPLDSLKFRG